MLIPRNEHFWLKASVLSSPWFAIHHTVNAYKTSFNANSSTTSMASPTSRLWLTWHLAIRQWGHLTAAIDIYPRGWLMSILLPTDFTPCKAKETMVNRTWAVRCILCSRSRLMAMSYRVIPAIIKERKPNLILMLTHSMLAHLPTFLLLPVRSMILTSVRCLDMACNIIPSSHLRLLWIRIRGLVQMLSYISFFLIQLRPFLRFLYLQIYPIHLPFLNRCSYYSSNLPSALWPHHTTSRIVFCKRHIFQIICFLCFLWSIFFLFVHPHLYGYSSFLLTFNSVASTIDLSVVVLSEDV